MLPDFPQTRKKLDEITMMQMRVGMHHSLGVLNQIKFKITREGHANRLVREDGTVDNIESRKISTKVAIPVSEAERWTAAQSAEKLAELSGEMAQQQASFVFEKLHAAVEKVGNVVDAEGNFTEEHYFKMLAQIQLDFGSDGIPRMPQVAGGAAAKIRAIELKIQTDPKLRERLGELIMQKREEWRAREASRTLVG